MSEQEEFEQEKLIEILEEHSARHCPRCGHEIGFGDMAWNNACTEAGTEFAMVTIQCCVCQEGIARVDSWYPGIHDGEDLLYVLRTDWKTDTDQQEYQRRPQSPTVTHIYEHGVFWQAESAHAILYCDHDFYVSDIRLSPTIAGKMETRISVACRKCRMSADVDISDQIVDGKLPAEKPEADGHYVHVLDMGWAYVPTPERAAA